MWSRRRPIPEIELLLSESQVTESSEPVAERSMASWRPMAGIVAVLALGMVVLRVWSSPVDRPDRALAPVPPPGGIEESAPSPSAERPENERGEDPYQLTVVSGPDLPILHDVSGVSVLYVNTSGHPTLVDLETGDRSELRIAADVDQYTFKVDHGRVVTDGAGPGEFGTEASDRAFSILAYRKLTAGTAGEAAEQVMALAPMCSEFGCSILGRGPTLGPGGDVLRLVSERTDPAVAALFDPSVWTREGAWMLAPAGSGIDLRLPAPAGYSPIYLVSQS